ncbi:MAG: FAD-binding protein [Actinobacteria bacterium]|nr:FAD-binding protein [Actinomycetota bacterium]
MVGSTDVDAEGLQRDLTAAIDGEVRFDRSALGLYATDASNFRQVPIGVVIPRTLDDAVETHRICRAYGAPILSRGGGTSLSGETVNYAVVIDHSKYLTDIGEPDADHRLVTVQNGAINEQVNEKTGKANLVFGPDPSSHSRCTIGGNVGNNSCGIHSVQAHLYGPGPRTSDNIHSLDIVTYDGIRMTVGETSDDEYERIVADGGRRAEIYRALRDLRDRYADLIRERYQPVDRLPRRVSGYNLDELLPEKSFNVARALVGTEGTCVTVLEATLMLTPALLERVTVVVACPNIADAGDFVPEIMAGFRPIGLEGIDHRLFEDQWQEHMHRGGLRALPGKGENAWLLVQFGADDADDAHGQAYEFADWLRDREFTDDMFTVYDSAQLGGESGQIWGIREGGLGATAFPPDGRDHWPGWEDSAVPPESVGPYIRDLQQLYADHGLRGAMYGHLGEGCVHSRISFDLRHTDGIRTYRAFMEAAADLVVSYGGTLSGEHGDGQQRAELLSKQFGPELVQAMREFKAIWDPEWKMNPGKVVDPYKMDEDLKLGVDYNPHARLPLANTTVRFAYPEDDGDFAHATLRCVGVGKCRNPDGAPTMCPSYMVTREEEHSTRGRARLLFEMLQGDVVTDGWQSTEVYDALDLCLACKGCTNDCPVNVDMPTYKAEFLYHHYKSSKRWRGRYMYAFGFIDQAARLASLVPGVVNALTQYQPFASLAKRIAGIDPQRQLPTFAPLTLQQWFAQRGGTVNPDGPRVILWPDTFNNYLHTDVGVACVEVLEDAGWQVVMPDAHVCCGRPLYDYGFLDVAERYLRRTIAQLRDDIRTGTPVVGMEPSCLAVFRDELGKLLPHDEDAQRLRRNAYHFAEFLDAHDIDLPTFDRDALVWTHCHHRATGGSGPEQQVLGDRIGMDVTEVSGGCCGLAGSWGFEQGKYDISMDCGEQALLPAVRDADADTVIVADGFSCKTQIEQAGTGRRALHVAEVIKLARHAEGDEHGRLPEDRSEVGQRPQPGWRRRVARGASVAGTVVAIAALPRLARR